MKFNVYRNEDILTTQGLDELLTLGEVKELERIAGKISHRLRREEVMGTAGFCGFGKRRRKPEGRR